MTHVIAFALQVVGFITLVTFPAVALLTWQTRPLPAGRPEGLRLADAPVVDLAAVRAARRGPEGGAAA